MTAEISFKNQFLVAMPALTPALTNPARVFKKAKRMLANCVTASTSIRHRATVWDGSAETFCVK